MASGMGCEDIQRPLWTPNWNHGRARQKKELFKLHGNTILVHENAHDHDWDLDVILKSLRLSQKWVDNPDFLANLE